MLCLLPCNRSKTVVSSLSTDALSTIELVLRVI
jgi:hypothetical protein